MELFTGSQPSAPTCCAPVSGTLQLKPLSARATAPTLTSMGRFCRGLPRQTYPTCREQHGACQLSCSCVVRQGRKLPRNSFELLSCNQAGSATFPDRHFLQLTSLFPR